MIHKMAYIDSGVARVWQSVALATPIFTRLLDILSLLNNAIKISAPKSWLYTKLSVNPHFSHTNVHGLATPLYIDTNQEPSNSLFRQGAIRVLGDRRERDLRPYEDLFSCTVAF